MQYWIQSLYQSVISANTSGVCHGLFNDCNRTNKVASGFASPLYRTIQYDTASPIYRTIQYDTVSAHGNHLCTCFLPFDIFLSLYGTKIQGAFLSVTFHYHWTQVNFIVHFIGIAQLDTFVHTVHTQCIVSSVPNPIICLLSIFCISNYNIVPNKVKSTAMLSSGLHQVRARRQELHILPEGAYLSSLLQDSRKRPLALCRRKWLDN